MLVTAKLKYVAESEWGLQRHLDVTLLEGQAHRRAGLLGCRKVRKNLDGTKHCIAIAGPPTEIKLKDVGLCPCH